MGEPICRYSIEARIGDDDFVGAVGSGVAVEQGLDVGLEVFADSWNLLHELEGDFVRAVRDLMVGQALQFLVESQCKSNLVVQLAGHVLNRSGHCCPNVESLIRLVHIVARIDDAEQIVEYSHNCLEARLGVDIEIVDGAGGVTPHVRGDILYNVLNGLP